MRLRRLRLAGLPTPGKRALELTTTNGIAPERISEIDIRYAAAMFARLGELADLPLSAARTVTS